MKRNKLKYEKAVNGVAEHWLQLQSGPEQNDLSIGDMSL